LAAGSNITITTNASTDTVTIAAASTDLSGLVTLATDQTITGSKTLSGTTTLGKYIESVYSAGNSSTSFTPNANNGPVQTLTANNNFTLNAPTNMTAGSNLVLIIRQDATGGRVMTSSASYKFLNGFKTLLSTANSINLVTIFYDGTDYLASTTVGYY
jgi:hypothetical protein